MKFVLIISVALIVVFPLSCHVKATTGSYGSLGRSLDVRNTADPKSRAEQALQGLFHYYWKSDPLKKPIEFFFVCGQIGGWGKPHSEYECSCNRPNSCVNCYRWWDAIALESIATYGIYTNSKNFSKAADVIFSHSPYNADWNATVVCTFIDDFSWYGIAYLRVYEWLKDPKWLNRSIALLDWAWEYGWDEPCGGFWWTNCDTSMFKDSITILEVLHLSAKLAYMFPNESQYLERTQQVWDWFYSFDDGQGLMSKNGLVSTGAIPEKCCNASSSDLHKKCHNSKLSGTSYNQGLLMSASAYLYLRTGNKTYLNVGLQALDAILTNYTTKEGVLVDEPRSYQSYEGSCWAGSDPGGDWYSFNGIFMLHLGYFTELLHENGSLPDSMLAKIMTLIEKSSDAAWNKSAVWPPFSYYDGCNIGTATVGPTDSYPKFHWWWNENVTKQIIPPDPKFFFRRRKLGCTGNNSQLWKGFVLTENGCERKCRDNPRCSKYQYHGKVSQLAKAKVNCWLWSFNRSDHSCTLNDETYTIGIKRPVGNVTCAGRCGSKEPLNVEHGVCYCDSDCAKHMDCCLDYADHCSSITIHSCKGLCGTLTPQPLYGGGYCWCFDGCNGWFTDNNSDGSCCPDYPPECMEFPMPVCLDARSQGSALNLFLAHLKLSKLTMN